MNFRDFISNYWYRRRAAREFARYHNLKAPRNPSKRYIERLVERLLIQDKAQFAKKELELIGATAVPSLVAALKDSRFHRAKWPEFSNVDAPFEAVLDLLVPHGGDHVVAATDAFSYSQDPSIRKTFAFHLARLGRGDTVSILNQLLCDADDDVRRWVYIGVGRAIGEGRGDESYRHCLYDRLLPYCDRDSDIAELLVDLNADRAAKDLTSPELLSPMNSYVHALINACNAARIILPSSLVREVLRCAMPLVKGDKCYPHDSTVAAAFRSLAMSEGDDARSLFQDGLLHSHPRVYVAATESLAMLAGIDPVRWAYDRCDEVGFENLTEPQQVVLCASLFEGEVCNGGIMQFFGNSSGDHVRETLHALEILSHPDGLNALRVAVQIVGPLAFEQDQDLRLTAFENRFDELRAVFEPLESAFYKTNERLHQQWILYALEHADHFRSRAKQK